MRDQEKHLAILSTQSEKLRQQQENEAEIRQRYGYLIALFLVVILFSLGMFYFFIKQKKAQVALKNEQNKLLTVNDQLRNSLSNNEILLNEIHHRVKNNMQVVSSLLDLQSDFTEDARVKQQLLQGKNRIKSIAMVHEMIHHTDDISEIDVKKYVQQIVEEIKNSLWSKSDANIRLHCDPLKLKLNDAIPIGILLNEQLTNSFKHAKTNGETLEINVKISHDTDSVQLTYSDNGAFKTSTSKKEGMGKTIIESMVQQLHGTIVSSPSAGYQFSFHFKPQ